MDRRIVDRLYRILGRGRRREGGLPGTHGNSGPPLFEAGGRGEPGELTVKRLDTPRMTVIALTVQQMRWQRDDFARLEQALGLAASGQRLEDELRPIVSRAISHMRRRPHHARWHCQWVAVLKGERRIVGSLAFKGPPDRDDSVEIGYGFDPFYHNRGLATEAVGEMVRWALGEDGVEAVIAETANMNVASMRVLQKVGFVIVSATSRYLYWKVSR